jgi:hypothetical protein
MGTSIRVGLVKVDCAKAATVKTVRTKIKLLKKDKTFIVPPRKIKNQKVFSQKVL